MTCDQFKDLLLGPRELETMSLAELSSLRNHGLSCRSCLLDVMYYSALHRAHAPQKMLERNIMEAERIVSRIESQARFDKEL